MAKKKKLKRKVVADATKPKVNRSGRSATNRKTKFYRPYKKREPAKGGYREFLSLLSSELKSQGIKLHEGRGGILKVTSLMWKDLQNKGVPFPEIKSNIEVLVPQYVSKEGKIQLTPPVTQDINELGRQLLIKIQQNGVDEFEWWNSLAAFTTITQFPEYNEGGCKMIISDESGDVREFYTIDQFSRGIYSEMKRWDSEQRRINTDPEKRTADSGNYPSFEIIEDMPVLKDGYLQLNYTISNYSFEQRVLKPADLKEIMEKEKAEFEKIKLEQKAVKESEGSELDKKIQLAKLENEKAEIESKHKLSMMDKIIEMKKLGFSNEDIEKFIKMI